MDSFTDHAGYAPSGYLDDKPMAALMKNADFRRQFVLTFLDMANENFRAERVLSLLDEIEAEYTAWADASWERWNANPQDKTFAEQVEELRVFFENRFDYIVPLSGGAFRADRQSGGALPVRGHRRGRSGRRFRTHLPEHPEPGAWRRGELAGTVLHRLPRHLNAQEAGGLEFVRWEVDGGTITEGSVSTPSIQVQLNGDTRIRAVYE